MESESSQYLLPCSSSSLTPPQNSIESFIGSFITLISNYDLRYEGVLYFLNLQDSILGLQNVICYGTEERRKNDEFQVPPINKVYDYIVFSGFNIKEIIVKPSTSHNGGYNGYSGRGGATSNKPRNATKPPLPLTASSNNSHGAKIRRKIPLISNGTLIKPQATTDFNAFSVNGLASDRLHIASNPLAQPQYPGSNLYDLSCGDHDYQSMPYGHVPNQDPINIVTSSQFLDSSASELMSAATQSYFTTFPPPPVSMPRNCGGLDFEAMSKNFSQYEIWGPPKKEDTTKPVYNIDGSFYMISRQPFEPIGRPCNPFGPIAKPVKQTEVLSNNLKRILQLQSPVPSNI